MSFLVNINYRVGSIYPKKISEKLKKMMLYAGLNPNPVHFLGLATIVILLMSIVTTVLLIVMFNLDTYIFPLLIILFIFITYTWLNMIADQRARYTEKIFPDLLQLMSSNLRTSLTPDKALMLAARPEFGPISKEIEKVGKRVFAGEELADALMEMTEAFDSKIIEKTITLLVKGIKSGGEMSNLLNQLSEQIRSQNIVEQEMQASVSVYSSLITFAAAIAAPVVFSISTFIVMVMNKQFSSLGSVNLDAAHTGGGLVSLITSVGSFSITPEFVYMLSMVFLIVIAFFGGMLIGVIKSGKALNGVRNSAILVVISLVIFILSTEVLSGVFAQIL